MRLLIAVVAVCLVAGSFSTARGETYKVDPVHSMVVFRIQHMGVSFVYGRFNDPGGSLVLDDDPSKMSFDVQVDTAKVDTNNTRRDDDLRSQRFFDAKTYPAIQFKSTSVKAGAKDKEYEVSGDMTLHGVTKPMTVKMTLVGKAAGQDKKTRAGFETTFTVKRSDYGMTTMLGTGVGDEVTLMVSLEAIQQ
jgi:polyisoprenoid-binding protein YceI